MNRRPTVELLEILDMMRVSNRLLQIAMEESTLLNRIKLRPHDVALRESLTALREEASLLKCSMPDPQPC